MSYLDRGWCERCHPINDAGRPLEAACFSAIGLRSLSMRPASIGAVKSLIRRIDLSELKKVIEHARTEGHQSVRPMVEAWLLENTDPEEG